MLPLERGAIVQRIFSLPMVLQLSINVFLTKSQESSNFSLHLIPSFK